MKEICVVQLVIGALIICSAFGIAGSYQTGQSNWPQNINDNSTNRTKRGLVLLVPSNSNESISTTEKNGQKKISPNQQKYGKRESPNGIFMNHNDMLDTRYSTGVTTNEDDETDTSTTYVRMRSVTEPQEILRHLAEARQSRRNGTETSSPFAIVLGRKINRPRGTRRKKYICYCKETSCPSGRCLQPRSELTWRPATDEAVNNGLNEDNDDETAEDTSAERTDPPESSSKVARMAEPTKFNIPFANNINFDQRVILGHPPVDRPKYPIYPMYQNQLPGAEHRPYSVYQHNPNVPQKSLYTTIPRTTPRGSEDYDDECISMYGRDVCATLATPDSSLGDSGSAQLSNEALRSLLRQKAENTLGSAFDYSDEIVKTGTVNTPRYTPGPSLINNNYNSDVESREQTVITPRGALPEETKRNDLSGILNMKPTNNAGKTKVKNFEAVKIEGQKIQSNNSPFTKVINVNNADTVSFIQNPVYDTSKTQDLHNDYSNNENNPDFNNQYSNQAINPAFIRNKNQPFIPSPNINEKLTKVQKSNEPLQNPIYKNKNTPSIPNNKAGSITTKRNTDTLDYASNPPPTLQYPSRKANGNAVGSEIEKSLNTESSIQSVDERPSSAFENNNNSPEARLDVRNKPNNRESLGDDLNRGKIDPSIMRCAVTTVLNNFVPDRAQDLPTKYGSDKVVILEANDLHPEIINAPLLRNLLAVPEVEDMLVDLTSSLLRQPNNERSELVRQTLHNVIEQIPYPVIATTTIESVRSGRWVTERLTSLESTTLNPTKEILEKISNIIYESKLGEHTAAHPVARNFIVKAVKHALDKSHGSPDEFAIRRAFNMIVRPQFTTTKNPVTWESAEQPGIPENKQIQPNEAIQAKGSLIDNLHKAPVYPIDTEPVRYYSPSDRILDYIKSHQSANEPSSQVTTEDVRTTRQSPVEQTVAKTQASDKINLQYEPQKPSEVAMQKPIAYTTPNFVPNNARKFDPSYLGKLLPIDQKLTSSVESLTDLDNSRLMYIGDGVRLPLSLKKQPDGTYALRLANEMCKRYANNQCPCCLPRDPAGVIVRERRSGDIITDLSFKDDDMVTSEEADKSIRQRNRRESGEYEEVKTFKKKKLERKITKKKPLKNKSQFQIDDGKMKDQNKNDNPKIKDQSKSDDGKMFTRHNNDDFKSKDKKYKNYNNKYYGSHYDKQEKKSLIEILKQIKNPQNKLIENPPYKYQQYAQEDENINRRTNVIKNVLYLVKHLLTAQPS